MDSLGAIGRIGIVGLSTHGHDAAELARFTVAREDRAHRLPELAAALGVRELVYLATCNRVELIFRMGEARMGEAQDADATFERELRQRAFAALLGRSAEPGEAERALRRWTGLGAVAHLFEVAAGLDSALVGEREIRGQLREALALARSAGTNGVLLDQLVEEALRVARQVHLRTQLGAGSVSLAEIAGELLLERVRRTPSPVALVGVTAMTRRCAEILRRESVPVVLVNRTLARAEALAAELAARLGSTGGVRVLTLDEFRHRPPQVEAVLCATGAPGAVLDRAALERLAAHTASQEPPLVVDLSVPPDVDPDTARTAQVPRIGIDEINGVAEAQRQSRQVEAAAARRMVDDAVRGLERRLAERALAPVIRRINRRYRETALEGVERLLAKQGFALAGAGREAVERWAETLARRFAHLPTLGLRGLAADQGMDAVRSFLEACDPGLVGELPHAARQPEQIRTPTRGPGRDGEREEAVESIEGSPPPKRGR